MKRRVDTRLSLLLAFGIKGFTEFVYIDIGHCKFSCLWSYLFCLLCAGRCATIHLIQR